MRTKLREFLSEGSGADAFQAALFHPGSNPEKVPHDVTSCVLRDAGKQNDLPCPPLGGFRLKIQLALDNGV